MSSFTWNVPTHFNFTGDVIDRIARENDHTALIWIDGEGREEAYSFADMSRLSARCAAALHAAGVGQGDRVIVMLPRTPDWQIAMLGVLRLGAVPIPCIDMLTEKDVAYRVAFSGAVAAITTAANTGKFTSALRARFAVGGAPGWPDFRATLAAAPDHFPAAYLPADAPAVMYFTSGSSGQPKGVLHPTRSLFAWRVSAEHWLDLHATDTMWCTADTGWSKAGTSILFGPWSRGATVLFFNGPFDPARRLDLLAKYKVSVYCAAATELRRVVQQDISRHDLSALRLTVSAGESVDPVVVREWEAKFGVPLRECYGQTETLMTVGYRPGMQYRRGSMGLPLPGTEAAVLDGAGKPMPTGEIGMLCVRLPLPQFMQGYWQDSELTESTMLRTPDGTWFQTGDLARADADGYLYYAGRADDVINASGYRIGPMEVEGAILEHPSVQECAVVPKPDAERGEVVMAWIVPKDGVRADAGLARAIQDHVKSVTAPYKYPRVIRFVDELPKTATGKISRRALRDRAAAER